MIDGVATSSYATLAVPGVSSISVFVRFVDLVGVNQGVCRDSVFFLVICEEGGLMMGTQAAPERLFYDGSRS
jgi:hypothetical protein